jgi:hypothetical protein
LDKKSNCSCFDVFQRSGDDTGQTRWTRDQQASLGKGQTEMFVALQECDLWQLLSSAVAAAIDTARIEWLAIFQ